VSTDPATFQPINANFGLLPALSQVVRNRRERNRLLVARAQADFAAWRQATEETCGQIFRTSPIAWSES
jgi:methylenetetrahydrofolate--tRNA-(uracil-5-)-methyltransferase